MSCAKSQIVKGRKGSNRPKNGRDKDVSNDNNSTQKRRNSKLGGYSDGSINMWR